MFSFILLYFQVCILSWFIIVYRRNDIGAICDGGLIKAIRSATLIHGIPKEKKIATNDHFDMMYNDESVCDFGIRFKTINRREQLQRRLTETTRFVETRALLIFLLLQNSYL